LYKYSSRNFQFILKELSFLERFSVENSGMSMPVRNTAIGIPSLFALVVNRLSNLVFLCPHSHSIVGRKQGAPVFDQFHVTLVTNVKLIGFSLFQGPEIKLCEVQHRALLHGLMGKWNVLRLI
jgi:hypothetical protein